ncbi:MAG: hypothetical protein AAF554_00300 [Bacteroidota bacterium]
MKKINSAKLLVLGFGLTSLVACRTEVKPEETHEDEPPIKVEAPDGIIDLGESKKLYDNYTRYRADGIENLEKENFDNEEFMAVRYTDFDFEDFRKYIDFVEQEAAKAKVDVSTVRVYFANSGGETHKNCVFFVPTLKKGDENFGFFIGADGSAKLIIDEVGGNAQQQGVGALQEKQVETAHASMLTVSAPMLFDDQSLAYNKGTSGPPPPPDY